ncbi:hypothetical protein GCM10010344_58740 [Streptomyces bluensis]|nr:hypothetical protein GCM10010344_58740 [Streptomyces bluensis]
MWLPHTDAGPADRAARRYGGTGGRGQEYGARAVGPVGRAGGGRKGAARPGARTSVLAEGLDKGCEPTVPTVLIFCVSEGAGPQGAGPEDTPNARVAE